MKSQIIDKGAEKVDCYNMEYMNSKFHQEIEKSKI